MDFSNDEIVYVGQTINPKQRFYQESRDEKFAPYLDSKIYITELVNSTEMNAVEKILINKYQPKLNTVDTHDKSGSLPFNDEDLIWEYYPNPAKVTQIVLRKNKAKDSLTECLGKYFDSTMLLDIMSNWQGMFLNSSNSQSFELHDSILDEMGQMLSIPVGCDDFSLLDDDENPRFHHITELIGDNGEGVMQDYIPILSHSEDDAGSCIRYDPWTSDKNVYTIRLDSQCDNDDYDFGFLSRDPFSDNLFLELESIVDFLKEKKESAALELLQRKDEYIRIIRECEDEIDQANAEDAA